MHTVPARSAVTDAAAATFRRVRPRSGRPVPRLGRARGGPRRQADVTASVTGTGSRAEFASTKAAFALGDVLSPPPIRFALFRAIRVKFKGRRVARRLGPACLAPASARLRGWNGACGGATHVPARESAGLSQPARRRGRTSGTPTGGVTSASRGSAAKSKLGLPARAYTGGRHLAGRRARRASECRRASVPPAWDRNQ